MSGPQRLGGLDAAFLAAETPANHLHMLAVLVLDPSTVPGGWSYEHLRDHIAGWVDRVPPLRRRLVKVPFGLDRPVWVDVPALDLDRHVRHVVLPGQAGPRRLAAYASIVAGRKLDQSRPLWELHVVEGLERDRVAIVAKLHHATMDGGAGMQFMASLFTLEPGAPGDLPPAPGVPGPRPSSPHALRLLAGAAGDALARPRVVAGALVATAGAGLRLARALAHTGGPIALPFAAPRTRLNGALTPDRSIAWTSVPRVEVDALRKVHGVTVNDVVLAALGGALRGWLAGRGDLPDRALVAAVPVSVRGEQGVEEANLVSLLLTGIGTNIAAPAERLHTVHEEAARAKALHDALGGTTLLGWFDGFVPLLTSALVRFYSGLRLADHHPPACNLLVSNVPGPPVPLYLGGARLEAIYPLGPIYDGVGLNVTILGGMDTFDIGLVACPAQASDLWDLADAIPGAFADLATASTKAS